MIFSVLCHVTTKISHRYSNIPIIKIYTIVDILNHISIILNIPAIMLCLYKPNAYRGRFVTSMGMFGIIISVLKLYYIHKINHINYVNALNAQFAQISNHQTLVLNNVPCFDTICVPEGD